MMSRRLEMRSSIVVDRRLEDFPAELGDPHSLARWDRSVDMVELDDGGPLRVGSTFATIGPRRSRRPGTRSEYRVVGLERYRNRVELLRHPLFATAIWTFGYAPRGDATLVTCSVEAILRRRWFFLQPALGRTRTALAGDLGALKGHIEGSPE
jgi:hypothetical protein